MDFWTPNLKKYVSAHLTKFRLTSGFHKLRDYAICAVWVLTRCVSDILIYNGYLGCIVKTRGESLSYVFNWLTNVCLGWFILKIDHILCHSCTALPACHSFCLECLWNMFWSVWGNLRDWLEWSHHSWNAKKLFPQENNWRWEETTNQALLCLQKIVELFYNPALKDNTCILKKRW